MGKPGSRTSLITNKEKRMIINIKQSKFRKSLDFLLTITGWIFLLLFLHNFLNHLNSHLSMKFYLLALSSADAIVIFTICILGISAALLVWWSFYNKRKYGSLKRRRFPQPANDKEVADYFKKNEDEIGLLQNDRYIDID